MPLVRRIASNHLFLQLLEGLLTSVQNIGGFIALPFAPYVTDGLGRRKGIFMGGVIMLGGVVLQSQSVNTTQFILARGLSEYEFLPFRLSPEPSPSPWSDRMDVFFFLQLDSV